MNTLHEYFLSTPQHIFEKGMVWYEKAHNEADNLAKEYGLTICQTAAIIARLSPSISWGRNLIAAENLLKGIDKIDGYGFNVEIARKIAKGYYGTQFPDVLESFPKNARKIKNFYINILFPEENYAVTVDRWMYRAYNPLCTNDGKIKARDYELIANKIRRIAKMHSLLPNQVQAVVWEKIRRLHSETF